MSQELLCCGVCDDELGYLDLGNMAHQEIIKNHPCFDRCDQIYVTDSHIYGMIVENEECRKEAELFTNEHEDRGDLEVLTESTQNNENTKWSEYEINLLIITYKENSHKFKSPRFNSKQVWNIISQELKKQNVLKDGTKCFEKWRNLKKMYEKVTKHNNATGNNRKNWPYYEVFINETNILEIM